MDESVIGKVLFVGIAAVVISIIAAVLHSTSEGARRLRMVVGGAMALAVAAGWFMMAGPLGFIASAVVGAAGFWIYKGFKK